MQKEDPHTTNNTSDPPLLNDLDTEIQIDNDSHNTVIDNEFSVDSTEAPSADGPSNYIRYSLNQSSSVLANAWKDPLYFTSAFPTLFPTGLGGHLDDRPLQVSLKAFAKWTYVIIVEGNYVTIKSLQ
jgi:hypothetical protein